MTTYYKIEDGKLQEVDINREIPPVLSEKTIIAGRSLAGWRAFATRDDCLDKMVPSDLRQLIGALFRKTLPDAELEGLKRRLVDRHRELLDEFSDRENHRSLVIVGARYTDIELMLDCLLALHKMAGSNEA